jgi:hypothetical protein
MIRHALSAVVMATWQLIEHASRTVVRLIESHIALAMPGSSVEVKLATPHSFGTLKNVTKSTVSIFLYKVNEHAELRNSPHKKLSDGTLRRPPMVLELCYLVTTWGSRGNQPAVNDAAAAFEEHKLLGVVMQGMYEHSEVSRAELFEDPTKPPVWGDSDALQVVLESLPIEDLYRIWDSSELAYQLSATYRVRVLSLDLLSVQRTRPVVDASFKIGRLS